MNSDLLTAIIIAGVFFLSMIGIFVDAFIREWIAETKDRNFYTGKSSTENPWVFAEVIPENLMRKISDLF